MPKIKANIHIFSISGGLFMSGTDKQAIYDEINKNIKEKGLRADIPEFNEVLGICALSESEFSSNGFSALVSDMDRTYFIHPSVPLKGNPIVVFIKKVIRKITRFYVEPAFNSQTEFNGNTVRTMRMVENYFDSVKGVSFYELNKKIEIMDRKLRAYSNEVEMLNVKVFELEKENSELKIRMGETK